MLSALSTEGISLNGQCLILKEPAVWQVRQTLNIPIFGHWLTVWSEEERGNINFNLKRETEDYDSSLEGVIQIERDGYALRCKWKQSVQMNGNGQVNRG